MRNKLQPLAMMMLVIVLCQGLFVAFEANADIHLPIDDDRHHELITDHSCAGGHCPTISSVDDSSDRHTPSSNPSSDTCDHCCACHGHGSHTTVLANAFSLVVVPFNIQPVAEIPQFYSFHPASLYRPPIA